MKGALEQFVVAKMGPGKQVVHLGYSVTLKGAVIVAEAFLLTSKEKYVPNPHWPKRTAWMSASSSICVVLDPRVRGGQLGPISYGEMSRLHRKPCPVVVEAAYKEGLRSYSAEFGELKD